MSDYLNKITAVDASNVNRAQRVNWGLVNPTAYRNPEEKPSTGEALTGVNTNLGIGSEISYPPQCGINRNGRTLAFG